MTQDQALTLSAGMVRNHLAQLTDAWFVHHTAPPPELSAYGPFADQVQLSATASGDGPWFVLALQHLLARPDLPVEDLGDDSYAYTDAQLRELFAFILQRMGQPLQAAGAAGVSVVEMSDSDWLAQRELLDQAAERDQDAGT